MGLGDGSDTAVAELFSGSVESASDRQGAVALEFQAAEVGSSWRNVVHGVAQILSEVEERRLLVAVAL